MVASAEYLLLMDQQTVLFIALLLWVGYSISGVASALDETEQVRFGAKDDEV